jgi:hypothetical protein
LLQLEGGAAVVGGRVVEQRTQTETVVYRSVANVRTSGSNARRLWDAGGSAVGDVGAGERCCGLMERMPGSPCTGFA